SVFADIRKAFLQIRLPLEDRKYVRYLWTDSKGQLVTHQFASVLFGATSSPYILFAVLGKLFREHSDQEFQSFPEDVYMDDGLITGKSSSELRRRLEAIQAIMSKGSFELHKFAAASEVRAVVFPSDESDGAPQQPV